MGEVLELGFGDDDNRYDGNKPYPHPHLICVRCRKIMDPEVSMAQDLVQQVASSWATRSSATGSISTAFAPSAGRVNRPNERTAMMTRPAGVIGRESYITKRRQPYE